MIQTYIRCRSFNIHLNTMRERESLKITISQTIRRGFYLPTRTCAHILPTYILLNERKTSSTVPSNEPTQRHWCKSASCTSWTGSRCRFKRKTARCLLCVQIAVDYILSLIRDDQVWSFYYLFSKQSRNVYFLNFTKQTAFFKFQFKINLKFGADDNKFFLVNFNVSARQ